jgi:hypothetical protein
LVDGMCRSTINVGSEVFTPSPITRSCELVKIPSQALAPFQSITRVSPRTSVLLGCRSNPHYRRSPLLRFVPLRRFPSHVERHTSDGSQTDGYVAPSGFRTLSTPCSPHDLPDLFHSGPVLGVNSSRLLSSHNAVRPLGRRVPREVPCRVPKNSAYPSRDSARCTKPAHAAWGLARTSRRMPP